MSGNVSTREARAFRHALDIPDDVWAALRENEASANVILPFAEKAMHFSRDDKNQLWIALYVDDGDTKNVELVSSCTKGPLDNYPIFVVASKAITERAQEDGHDEDLINSLRPLVRCLLREVPAQRVFSIFSIAKVTSIFAKIFVAEAHERQATDIHAHEEPYYDATFTFCTKETLNPSPKFPFTPGESRDVSIVLRLADISHLDGVTVLCKEFSEDSPPYVLDDADAKKEARTMIEKQQVWVHLIHENGKEPEVACIVATTRASADVTAVTKVFTAKRWRGHKCAERLLHRVCSEIFRKKNRVVLYVGNSLVSARKVYRRVGFQGLDEQQESQPAEGVQRWLEIGFQGTEIGYW